MGMRTGRGFRITRAGRAAGSWRRMNRAGRSRCTGRPERRVGAAMRGGSIFVRGNVGADTGRGHSRARSSWRDAGETSADGLNNVTVFPCEQQSPRWPPV